MWLNLDLWRFFNRVKFPMDTSDQMILALNSDSWDSNLASRVSAWSPRRSISKLSVPLVNVYCGARKWSKNWVLVT